MDRELSFNRYFLCGYVVAQSVFVSDKTSLKDGISNSNV